MQKVICPYCGRVAKYVDSSVIYYGHSYGMAYLCRPCNAYVKWQAGKLGRDINPSELTRRMMVNGVKRVVIRSPVYTELRSGNVATDASGRVALADLTDTVPQVGKLRGRTVTSGGYEDE